MKSINELSYYDYNSDSEEKQEYQKYLKLKEKYENDADN